jgi:hypothetical protein
MTAVERHEELLADLQDAIDRVIEGPVPELDELQKVLGVYIASLVEEAKARKQQSEGGQTLFNDLASRLIGRIVSASDMSDVENLDIEVALARIIGERDALVEEAKRNAELAELANSLIWWVEIGREVIDDREAGLYQPPEFCCICQEPKPPHAEGCPMETIEPADSFTDIDRAKWTDPLDALAAAQSERELPDD